MPCFAGDLQTDYTAKKAAKLIDRIEIDEGYVGPEVRYRIFVKRFSPETGQEVEPQEIYVTVEELQELKIRIKDKEMTKLKEKANNLDVFIKDLQATPK